MNALTRMSSTYLTLSTPFGRRGFRTFMSVLTKLMPGQAKDLRTVILDDGQLFSFPAGDPYWQYYFLTGTEYEQEIRSFISSMSRAPAFFLDGGANYGFWSIFVSKLTDTVAVEASSDTSEILRLNNRTNGDSFKVEHAALSDRAGAEVSFSKSADHASRSIINGESDNMERVVTTTVDDIIERNYSGGGPILIKLDVEGAEVAAFEGAKRTFERNSVFIYEDHGNDRACRPTAYLLEHGKRVYMISKEGTPKQVFGVDEVRALKMNPRVGYNFVALGDRADNLC